MAMANLAPPNQNDPNDPAQKALTGPIQNLQSPMFRNFQEFVTNPFVQDRVSAMINQSSPPLPSASMAASMQANGQTPAQPSSQQSLPQPVSQPSLNAPAPSQVSMPPTASQGAGATLQSRLQQAATQPPAGASTPLMSSPQPTGGSYQQRFAQAAGLPDIEGMYQDWRTQNPSKLEQNQWTGASTGRKLLDILRVASGAIGGGLPGAVGETMAIHDHDLPQNIDAANRQRFDTAVMQPLNTAATLQERLDQAAGLRAGTAKTQLETEQLQAAPPWQKNVQELQQSLISRWQQADMSPQDYSKWAQMQLAESPYASRMDPGFLQQVTQLPRKQAYSVQDKDDVPATVNYYGKTIPIATDGKGEPLGYQIQGQNVAFDDQRLPEELRQAAPVVQQNYRSYMAKRNAKKEDEGYVAQQGADRQAAGFAQAEHMSELHEDQKQQDGGRNAYYKALSDFNTKKSEVDSIKSNVQMAMDPKNPNPYAASATALSLVGISLPPGTKRMTDTELHQFQNQGSAGQRLAAAFNGYVVGTKMTPQQAKAINAYADQKMQQHTQEFNSTADSIQGVYGYRAPFSTPTQQGSGAPSGSIPAQAAAQLQEGVEHTFRNGQVWTKKSGKPVRVR